MLDVVVISIRELPRRVFAQQMYRYRFLTVGSRFRYLYHRLNTRNAFTHN